MADQLQFRGGTTAQVNEATVVSREIIIDTSTDQIVSGPSKKKTVMEDANGDVEIGGGNIDLKANGSGTFAGNFGIGTSSPSYLLDVRRSSAGDVVAFTGSTDGGRPLKFASADNGIFLGAQWTRDILSGGGIHAWAINGSERLRLDSSGAATFSGGTVLIEATSNTANAQLSLGRPNSTSAGYIRYINSENALAFRTNGSGEDFRIDSSGNLLIGGTTAASADIALNANGSITAAGSIQSGGDASTSARPAGTVIRDFGLIQIASGASDNAVFVSYEPGNNNPTFTLKNDGSASFAGNVGTDNSMFCRVNFKVFDGSAAAPSIQLNGNGSATFAGNLGVGTTAPAYQLDVQGSGNSRIRVKNTSVSGEGQFHHDGNGDLFIKNSVSGRNLAFVNTGSEAMRIDGSGRLLVGTSSNSDVRDITKVLISHGGSGANQNVGHVISCYASNDNSSGFIDFNKSNSPTQGTHALVGSDNLGQINFRGSDGAKFVDAASIKGESEGTAGTDDMPGRLVFSTTADGASSPTERLRIDSSGRLLVGTSSPSGSSSLQVAGKIATLGLDSAFGSDSIPTIYRSGSTSGSYPFDNFGHLIIQPRADGNPRDIVFATGNGGANKTVIDSSGRVGIGDSAPNVEFSLKGTSDVISRVQATDQSNARVRIQAGNASSSYLEFGDSDDDDVGEIVYGHSDNHMRFRTNGSERLRIDSSGNVGIGTTSPQAALDIFTSTGPYFRGGSDNAARQLIIESSTTTNAGDTHIFRASSATGVISFANSINSERLRIDSSGNVGIGTSSPSGVLHVKANTDATSLPSVVLEDSGTTNTRLGSLTNATGDIILASTSSLTDIRASVRLQDDRQIILNTANTERMRIDSSGRLLVGTSNTVSIAGSSGFIQQHGNKSTCNIALAGYANNLGGPILAFGASRSTTVGTAGVIVNSGDILGDIRFAGDDGTDINTTAASIRSEVDGTPGSNDMPGRLVFATAAAGASSPTERVRVSSNGRFSAFGTSISHVFRVSQTSSADTAFVVNNNATNTTTGTAKFVIRADGDAENTNNSYGALSDAKLKENIVDAASQWNDIKNIRVRNYNFIEGDTHKQLGVVAQEIETVSPGLVKERKDIDAEGNTLSTTTKAVNYSVLYMKAVKALQEAMERIETLEQRLSEAGIT